MKSKIEARVFAINKAVEIMGSGAVIKDVVNKAQEIEAYVIGEADLPEVSTETSPMDIVNSIMSMAGSAPIEDQA
jgi:hypothetical protein